MKIDEMLRDAREAMGARTVYGDPIVRNGTKVVPGPEFSARAVAATRAQEAPSEQTEVIHR